MLPTIYIRQLHVTVSRLVRDVGRRSNPGVGHLIAGMENVEERIEEDPEGFGDLESDFRDAHKTHREHEREIIEQRERIRHLMIKHKYFREPNLPNLLTYAEKEQIRLLHARDPEEWTAERLAESFPATMKIVQKIIAAKWQPRTAERIRKHDEKVIQNWEKFAADPKQLQLPPELQAHLEKFVTRRAEDIRIHAQALPPRPPLPRPKRQEFLSIITSCDKYAENKSSRDTPMLPETTNPFGNKEIAPPLAGADETYLLEKVCDKRKMRLQELKKYKLTPTELAASRTELTADSKKAVTDVKQVGKQQASAMSQNPSDTGVITTKRHSYAITDSNMLEKYESSEIVISAEDQKRFEITRIKDRIYIPRKVWRSGATYRVEDVYYDDDGEFLYRVPGMTGRRA